MLQVVFVSLIFTSDVSTLCFKSGNCVILRGGSEAYFSNKILAHLFRKSLEKNKISHRGQALKKLIDKLNKT